MILDVSENDSFGSCWLGYMFDDDGGGSSPFKG